jgi:dihydroceramide fatty acyl 2-hydroxylase
MIRFTQETLDAAAGRFPARSPDPRPRPRSIRVFRSDFLDAISYAHPLLPAVLWVPPMLVGLWRGVTGRAGFAGTLLLFLGGWLLWTLVEYVLHRFLFHWVGSGDAGRMFHFLAHGYHHEFPDDKLRLVAPPMMSGPIALVLGTFWYFVVGDVWVTALAGTIFGYLCYDYIHYYTHHARPRGGPGKWLRTYHMRHHFEGEPSRFGVSNPLWDFVFGTYAPTARITAGTGTPGRAR